MLTIKHIEADGSEGIIEAKSVHIIRREKPVKLHAYGVEEPMSYDDGTRETHAVTLTFGNGFIYVMNASGSTIASYDLDALNSDAR